MERRNFVVVALCVAIGIMAVAYAAFATTLNVNGTINASGTFAVTFTGSGTCRATNTVGTDTPTGTWSAANGSTTATLNVDLYTPGDVVYCEIPVKNTGTLAAVYVDSTISNNLDNESTPIAVEVNGRLGAIAANTESFVAVTITYNWSGNSQPPTTNKTFSITSNFTQAIS